MKTLYTVYHEKNELFEVEFYQDKECTEAFNFTGKKHLYIQLNDGSLSVLMDLLTNFEIQNSANIYTPYLKDSWKKLRLQEYFSNKITTLDDITPNLSKYIPEDSEVLLIEEEYRPSYKNGMKLVYFGDFKKYPLQKKVTLLYSKINKNTVIDLNNIAKELKEKHGAEEVNLFVLHCFVKYSPLKSNEYYINDNGQYIKYSFDNFITTNSTGILPVQNTQRLQVVDCKEIFEEYLKENN